MLPKAETAADVAEAARAAGVPVVALIESARGVAGAREVAGAAARLLFGSIDLAADLGCAEERDALLSARCEVVLASRLAGLPAPIDGVTPGYRDPAPVEADARYAARLGFGGKLLIHPAQIAPARAGFAPTEAEVAWAQRVLAAAEDGRAVALDGAMVDAPVRMRAERILARSRRAGLTSARRRHAGRRLRRAQTLAGIAALPRGQPGAARVVAAVHGELVRPRRLVEHDVEGAAGQRGHDGQPGEQHAPHGEPFLDVHAGSLHRRRRARTGDGVSRPGPLLVSWPATTDRRGRPP